MNNIMRVWILMVFVWSVSLVPIISKATELNEKITKDLEFKNGIAFLPNENEPFTGTYASHLVKISPQDQLKLEKLLQDLDKLNNYNAHQMRNQLLEGGCAREFAKRIMSAEPYGYITSTMLWSDDSFSEPQKKPKPKNKDGRKCYEEHYVAGILDGLRTSWWPNGHKMNETMYRTGKPDGMSYSWFENGQPSGQLSYINGQPDGLKQFWHENGQLWVQENYENGQLTGLSTTWNEKGEKSSESTYLYGKPDGLQTDWFENGQKRSEQNFKDGMREGLATEWYPNGKKKSETNYLANKEDGVKTEWSENGNKLFETHFKDGKKNGLKTQWYENGQKKEDSNWLDDTPFQEEHGIKTSFYETGKKMSEANLDTGISKSWYPSGKLLMQSLVNKNTPFPKGAQIHIPDTNSTQWYENGQKMRETIDSFSRVIRHDTEWFDNGQIRRDENLKDGKVAIIEWDVNGNKVHELNMLITGQKINEIHYVNGVKSEE